MDRRLFMLCAVIFLAIAFISYANAQPGEGIKCGQGTIHLIGKAQEQYDSNVFLDPSGAKDDWVTTLSPGMTLEWPFAGDNLLRAGYIADFLMYGTYTKQNAINHTVNAGVDVQMKDVKISVDDVFRHVYDRPDTEFTQRLTRDINNLGVKAAAEYNRLGYELGYNNIYTYYETEGYQYENRFDNLINGIITYRIYTKTKLLFEFDYGNINYVKKVNSDSSSYQGLIGIRGELTAKCTGEVKAGWQYRDYTRATENDFDSLVTMAGLQEDFTERDILKINWLRSPFESLYTGTNYYIMNMLNGSYIHKFTDKFSANIGGGYQLAQYPTETTEAAITQKRLDSTWSVGAGVEYTPKKWIVCKAGYEFRQRDSNFGIYSWDENLATASVNVVY